MLAAANRDPEANDNPHDFDMGGIRTATWPSAPESISASVTNWRGWKPRKESTRCWRDGRAFYLRSGTTKCDGASASAFAPSPICRCGLARREIKCQIRFSSCRCEAIRQPPRAAFIRHTAAARRKLIFAGEFETAYRRTEFGVMCAVGARASHSTGHFHSLSLADEPHFAGPVPSAAPGSSLAESGNRRSYQPPGALVVPGVTLRSRAARQAALRVLRHWNAIASTWR